MELLTFTSDGKTLTVSLCGRLDSSNSEAAEAQIAERRSAENASDIIIDAQELEYISSAGLRVILRLRKEVPGLRIVNASTEVYDIFEMTGFTEMMQIEKAFRRMSVEGCEVIGRGAKGAVYRYDRDTIIKVYKDLDCLPEIQRERDLARKAFVLGIPTAIPFDVVRVGENYGSVFELLDAKSFSQLINENPADLDKYITLFAALLRHIHKTEVKPDDMPDAKLLGFKWMATDEKFLEKDDAEKLTRLIKETPDTLNMLHCDFHTNNIMMQNGETLMIDMDTISHGHPVFDLANVCFAYESLAEVDPENVASFLGMPQSLYRQVWGKFLPLYLETDDEKRVAEVDGKVRLLAYARLLRHFARRGGADTAEGAAAVSLCVGKIHELLKNIDTLDF